ncbi:hypothetical protein SO694_00060218 [Aureococcus anophagefferens]|uniref:PsbP C-terminal domain-containing protein n=1 Tax=Aureococcus anophagefferens TaxID=44056 RepID=A0ABR1FR42_AURAN
MLALTLCAAALCADALDVSRRKVLHTPAALAALATPPAAVAADAALSQFDDGTLALRFPYPSGWSCKGTGAFESLITGRRVTTRRERRVRVRRRRGARMVPSNDIYNNLERAISADEVVEMTVDPKASVAKTTLRDFGSRRGYVVESSLGPTTSVDLFTVHSGDQGQYWAITLTATAKNAADLPRGVIDACDFYRLFDKAARSFNKKNSDPRDVAVERLVTPGRSFISRPASGSAPMTTPVAISTGT